MVGAPNLPAYLGLPVTASTAELTAALQARRRLLQGMLANPKLQREASFVVKNMAALEATLQDVPGHVEAMIRRAETRHVPALELMLDGVLASGPLSPDRERQLLRGVLALGLREQTFRALLARAVERSGVTRAPAPSPPLPPTGAEPTLYALLQVLPTAGAEEVRTALAERVNAAESVGAARERLSIAGCVLLHPGARRLYDRHIGLAPTTEPREPDLYDLLGLPSTATASEIQRAYEGRLASTPEGPDGEIARQRLEIARLVLRHQGARHRYDRSEADAAPGLHPAVRATGPSRVRVTRRLVVEPGPLPDDAAGSPLPDPGAPAVAPRPIVLGAVLLVVVAVTAIPVVTAAALAALGWLASR